MGSSVVALRCGRGGCIQRMHIKAEEKGVTQSLHVRRGALESTSGRKRPSQRPSLLCPFFIGVQLFLGQACTRAASVLRPALGRPHSQRIMGKG